MIIAGFQIILGGGTDPGKVFTIGLPLIFGLSLEILPSMYAGLPF
jgi:hypothetical protein